METQSELDKVDTVEFNIFKFFDSTPTHESAFTQMCMKIVDSSLQSLQGKQKIEQSEVHTFLAKIWQGYAEENPTYHNGIHGADVCQMTFYLLNEGGLRYTAKLDQLDVFAVLIAAACHDFKHDGFNNPYHTRIESDRFQRFGSSGVQEHYHFAESYAILTDPSNNLLRNMKKYEQVRFKRRMQGCIMATDMGRHGSDLKQMQQYLAENTLEAIEFEPITFTQQQQIVDLAVHTSDISFQTRGDSRVSRVWMDLLFEEFFTQGDLERDAGVDISMLCNRQKDKVAGTQPGFIKFCIVPLLDCVIKLSPSMEHLKQKALESAEHWGSYEETEDEKQIYTNKTQAKLDANKKLWSHQD